MDESDFLPTVVRMRRARFTFREIAERTGRSRQRCHYVWRRFQREQDALETRWRKDLAAIVAELDAAERRPVIVETLIASMPDGGE